MTSVEREANLEAALGYQFRDPVFLRTALTPPSSGLSPNNQRYEFLGDAILQFCVSRLIFQEHPHWDEGAMSKLRGLLVCTETLRDWAQDLDLALEKGPRSTKRESATLQRKPMADAMEALIAGVYLDAQRGGAADPMAEVSRIVEAKFLRPIRAAFIGIWEDRDSKTTLQERAAAEGLPAPRYELIDRSGPDHAPTFTVRVSVGEREATATSGTLKRAQADAARNLIPLLGGAHAK